MREIRKSGSVGAPGGRPPGATRPHSGRLFQTITRHFQQWRRDKAWWSFQFGRAHDPGVTYPRGNVEVAVRVTPASRAIDTQGALMRRLQPRDNVISWPAEVAEEVPF